MNPYYLWDQAEREGLTIRWKPDPEEPEDLHLGRFQVDGPDEARERLLPDLRTAAQRERCRYVWRVLSTAPAAAEQLDAWCRDETVDAVVAQWASDHYDPRPWHRFGSPYDVRRACLNLLAQYRGHKSTSRVLAAESILEMVEQLRSGGAGAERRAVE